MTNPTQEQVEEALACAEKHIGQINQRGDGGVEHRPLLALAILAAAYRMEKEARERAEHTIGMYEATGPLTVLRVRAEQAEANLECARVELEISESQLKETLRHRETDLDELEKMSVALKEKDAQIAELLDVARHTHQARRSIEGKLMDACNQCGLDLRHEVHRRAG